MDFTEWCCKIISSDEVVQVLYVISEVYSKRQKRLMGEMGQIFSSASFSVITYRINFNSLHNLLEMSLLKFQRINMHNFCSLGNVTYN